MQSNIKALHFSLLLLMYNDFLHVFFFAQLHNFFLNVIYSGCFKNTSFSLYFIIGLCFVVFLNYRTQNLQCT